MKTIELPGLTVEARWNRVVIYSDSESVWLDLPDIPKLIAFLKEVQEEPNRPWSEENPK